MHLKIPNYKIYFIPQIIVSVGKKMIANLLRLAHSALIIQIFVIIFREKLCPLPLVGAELGLTILRTIVEKKTSSTRKQMQILLSLLLGYTVFPNKCRQISWLYFAKIIEIHKSLKQLRKSSLLFGNADLQRYFAFCFDFFRFSLNQFVFFWFICIIYRYLCDSTHEPIPETHKLIYQLIVTASTIGYGDLTPKSDMQIIFFIFAIPVLCASFVVYINSIVDSFTNAFLVQEEEELLKKE